jgi:hypothetical protein
LIFLLLILVQTSLVFLVDVGNLLCVLSSKFALKLFSSFVEFVLHCFAIVSVLILWGFLFWFVWIHLRIFNLFFGFIQFFLLVLLIMLGLLFLFLFFCNFLSKLEKNIAAVNIKLGLHVLFGIILLLILIFLIFLFIEILLPFLEVSLFIFFSVV